MPVEITTTNAVTIQGIRDSLGVVESFNAKRDYGAVGDNAANDTSAIAAALSAANSAGGGTVYLPAGQYLITSGLTIPANVKLIGDGIGLTIIKASGAFTSGEVVTLSASRCELHHVSVRAQTTSEMTAIVALGSAQNCIISNCEGYNASWCLYLIGTSVENILVEKCYFHDHLGSGGHIVELNDANDCTLRDCLIVGHASESGGHGIELYLTNVGRLQRNRIENCKIDNAYAAAIGCYADTDTAIVGNKITSSRGAGIQFLERTIAAVDYQCTRPVVTNNRIVDPVGDGLYGTPDYAVITDNVLSNVGGEGLAFDSCESLRFANNVIDTCHLNGVAINDNCIRATLLNNLVRNPSGVGAVSRWGFNIRGDKATLVGNSVVDDRGGSSLTGYAYVVAAEADATLLHGNRQLGATLAGVLNSGTNTVLSGNDA